jgi:uncharacterized membrane protein YphA (DoxX/SURF4 family)
MTSKRRRIILLSIRILLGLVFLLSGIGKLIDSGYVNYELVRLLSTQYYWIIEYAAIIMISISIIELLIAVLLLWGKLLKTALAGALLMLVGFSSVLGYFYLQGMNVASCGCFGALGIGGGLEFSLIKNGVMIVLIIAAFVLISPKDNIMQSD